MCAKMHSADCLLIPPIAGRSFLFLSVHCYLVSRLAFAWFVQHQISENVRYSLPQHVGKGSAEPLMWSLISVPVVGLTHQHDPLRRCIATDRKSRRLLCTVAHKMYGWWLPNLVVFDKCFFRYQRISQKYVRWHLPIPAVWVMMNVSELV